MHLIRKSITEIYEQASPLQGEIEVDESAFCAKQIKGKRSRGASGNTPLFCILQRKGNVYTENEDVPDCLRKILQGIIRTGCGEFQIAGDAIRITTCGIQRIVVCIIAATNLLEGKPYTWH